MSNIKKSDPEHSMKERIISMARSKTYNVSPYFSKPSRVNKIFEAKKQFKLETDRAVHKEIKQYTKTVENKPAFYYYKKRTKGVLNYLQKQSHGFCNIVGDLADEPIVTAKRDGILKTKFRKNIPTEYLFLNEYPEQHDETDTKLFYLKEINNYISSGKLKKYLNSDEILKTYRDTFERETELFNQKVAELGFEAALESLIKKHRVDFDRFVDRNNYFSQPKEIVAKIFKAIQDPDSNRIILESLGMAENVFDSTKYLKKAKSVYSKLRAKNMIKNDTKSLPFSMSPMSSNGSRRTSKLRFNNVNINEEIK